MTEYRAYASVILDVAIEQALDYGISPDLLGGVQRGSRVEVPLRNQLRSGFVSEIKSCSELPRIKPIHRLLSPTALLTEELFTLALWMARYYCASLGDVIKAILPSSLRGKSREKEQLYVRRAKTRLELAALCSSLRTRSKGQAAVLDVMLKAKEGMLLTELLEKAQSGRSVVHTLVKKEALTLHKALVTRSPLVGEEYVRTRPKALDEEQKKALAGIADTMQKERFATHLLYGITGSGKTEVYLQAIDLALKEQRGAILLVPEIALTPQTVEQLRSRFAESIAVLHHRLSHGERFDEWHRLHKGKAKIAIGARSAIFCPVQNLGIIIVDEEHESSYKQTDSAPCYSARDVAVMRGKLAKAAVVLGSATPSLESYHNALQEKYTLSTLRTRRGGAVRPHVRIIDMAKEREKAGGHVSLAAELLSGIEKRCETGEQTLLLLNRRGYHTALLCTECKQTMQCAHCDLALTFHRSEERLSCHLCGHGVSPPPTRCLHCSAPTMRYKGIGTQQVEKALHAIFPTIRVLRMDADTTRHKGSHEKLLREFGSGKADVLVGTQMIAKGLHFPQVTLVGILNSGASLHIPDFRAAETVFQLITQVAGRAGRADLPGEVLIQTHLAENQTIHMAAAQDFDAFAKQELKVRKLFGYPPFARLARVLFISSEENKALAYGESFRQTLISLLPPCYEAMPLAPCGYAKIKDKHRFQLLVRGPSSRALSCALEKTLAQYPRCKQLRVLVDINPLSTYF